MAKLVPWGVNWAIWAVSWVALEFVVTLAESGADLINYSWPLRTTDLIVVHGNPPMQRARWVMSVTMLSWLTWLILRYPYKFSW